MLQSPVTNSKSADSSSVERLLAERVQVYDRLCDSSSIDPERLLGLFTSFSLPRKEKKKKDAIAKSLCECRLISLWDGDYQIDS